MAKKDNKKSKKPAAKAKKQAKPVAKKPAPKKPAPKKNKPAPKKVVKPVKKSKPAAKSKPAPKKTAKATKPAAKPVKGKTVKTILKSTAKKVTGKPIDAIKKKGAENKKAKSSSKNTKDKKNEEEDDVVVADDYEKNEDEDEAVGELDEAGLVDLDGAVEVPEIDDDDEEEPIKRGRGRRKKNEGKSIGGSMEAYIRNRPLQVDLSKPLIKKSNANVPKPYVNTKDNRSRYTDKELAEFKELILEKLKEAQADYDLLKQTLSNEDNHGTDDTSPTFKLLEDGSDVMSKEETAQLASRQEKYIINLKNALVRIENKSYGICRVTGKLIPKERLRSVPHATLSIDAKLNQNN